MEKEIIRSLSKYPADQLELLEEYLQKRKRMGELIDNDLLIVHISLLCRSDEEDDQNRLMKSLLIYEYPLEACFEICRFYDKKDACAFIEEKTGNFVSSVKIKIEVILR